MIARAAVFVLVFAALQLCWQGMADTAPGRATIEKGVVVPAAAMLRLMCPAIGAQARGNALLAPDGGIRVVNGCDGMEALLMLLAGVCVAPLTSRDRLGAIALGIPLVYGLNLVRILALFLAQRRGPESFDLWHSLLGPVLMVAAILGYFHFWLSGHDPCAFDHD